MIATNRRYDIDWLRVIAIGLLLVYHVAIGFQSWGLMIGFITNGDPLSSLWIPMGMLNIWRIPFLFFVSGMGVYFAMNKRSWTELLGERTLRILVPFLFGMFCIFPLSIMIPQAYYKWDIAYSANPGHLWFLGNIFFYVLLLSPLLYWIRRNEQGRVVQKMKKFLATPFGLLAVTGIFIAEQWIIQPNPYELYAMTWHGFFLGLLAFFFGFCFVLSGENFWKMLLRWRWIFAAGAITLFCIRLNVFNMRPPGFMLVTESQCWILAVFSFGHKYLNRKGPWLEYLSQAAYPVYILHMIFLGLGSWLIFPLAMSASLKFILVLAFTFAGCFLCYEFLIRRVDFIRPFFGLKVKTGCQHLDLKGIITRSLSKTSGA
jgi:glucans biosynthesis protein C